MSAIFGIHIGNTTACIAFCKDEDRIEVLANDTGDRLTPTTVQWTPGQCLVGRSAVLEQFRHLNNTIIRNKQVINEMIAVEELEELRQNVPYKILKTPSSVKYEVIIDGKQYQVSPKEIALAIFKKLYDIGETAVPAGSDLQVVLTVPQYFSESSINLIKEVGQKAGFTILQVIDDVSATLLATVPSTLLSSACVVIKIGGTTTEVSIVEIIDGMYSIKASAMRTGKAGRWITAKLTDFLVSEFTRQCKGQEITERGKFKLEAEAEKAKQILSIQNVAQCSAESVGGGFDLNCSVSRPRLDNIVSGMIPDMSQLIKEVVKVANLELNQIQKVALCGGTAKIPKIQEAVKKIFPNGQFLGVSSVSPDEVIAIGAAVQAKLLSKLDFELPGTLSYSLPVTQSSVLISVKDAEGTEVLQEVVKRHTAVPFILNLNIPNSSANLSVTLEENEKPLKTISLGDHVNDAPSLTRINIDRDGNLNVELPTCDIVV